MNLLLHVGSCLHSSLNCCTSLYFSKGALAKCVSLLKFVEFTKKLWHEDGMS